MKSKLILFAAFTAFLLPAAFAQEEKAKGPEFDEGARKLWDGWKKKRYHLADQGLKKASVKFMMKASSPMGAMNIGGSYVWHGTKGTIEWDDPNMGAMMERGGGGFSSLFEQWFDPNKEDRDLAGTKIVSSQDGDYTLLKVEGKAKSGLTEMRFDKEGVPRKMVIKQNNPQMGGQMTMKFDAKYEDVEGKLLLTGYEGTMSSAMGESKTSVTFTFETKGKYRVPVKQVNLSSFAGQEMKQEIEFTDWKFDDEVK